MNLGKVVRETKELVYRNDSQYQYSKNYEKLQEIGEMMKFIEEEIIEINGHELMEGEPFFRIQKKVEQEGWDVIIQTNDKFCRNECIIYKDCSINQNKIGIEIKPSIGDDFPDILRQMKAASIHPYSQCLVYEHFNTSNVSFEQVKEYFSTEGFLIYSIAEIENEVRLLIEKK
jgi:hypothetical protein